MGKVILTFKDKHIESFKCKSSDKAKLIAAKRPNVKDWVFYEENACIPRPMKKRKIDTSPRTAEDYEALLRMHGIL